MEKIAKLAHSVFFISVLFVASCEVTTKPNPGSDGDKMSDSTKSAENILNEHLIIVNDYGANTRKIKPAEEFPETMRFLPKKMISNGKEEIKKVAVREIIIRPLDGDGKLVEMQKAKIVSIQYLDGDGNVLQSTTMQKN